MRNYQRMFQRKPHPLKKTQKGVDDPRFAVLKERTHIYSRLKKMAEDVDGKTNIATWTIRYTAPLSKS